MSVSDVAIINMALSHLGHSIFIDSRSESGQEVAVANVHYDQAVAYTLEDFAWSCARRYWTLELVEEEPNDDWAFSYRYPVDTAKIRRIVVPRLSSASSWSCDPSIIPSLPPAPFVIGSDDTGRLIYTNQEDAVAETTRLITDTSLFPAMFTELVSWWLAGLMVPGLAKDPGNAVRCFAMYEHLRGRAAASDGNESQHPPEEDSEAIRARL